MSRRLFALDHNFLKVSQKSADPAQTYLDKIALRTKTTAARLFSENKLSPGDLQRR